MKWKIFGRSINNNFNDLNNEIIVVNKKYVDLLNKHNIPYNNFSEEVKKCFFIRNGKGNKPKKFNENLTKIINEEHKKGLSYRILARKYDCSTRTIYQILNNKY